MSGEVINWFEHYGFSVGAVDDAVLFTIGSGVAVWKEGEDPVLRYRLRSKNAGGEVVDFWGDSEAEMMNKAEEVFLNMPTARLPEYAGLAPIEEIG